MVNISNINLYVTGRNNKKEIVGFGYCNCYNCSVNIKGDDGYGVSVIGLSHCKGDNISVTATGGRGARGSNGPTNHIIFQCVDGGHGGSGSRGGDATSIIDGKFKNINFEKVVGGDGGNGGTGGDGACAGQSAGNGGNGGNGGNAYVVVSLSNGTAGKAGSGGGAGSVSSLATPANHGRAGVDGKVIKINY